MGDNELINHTRAYASQHLNCTTDELVPFRTTAEISALIIVDFVVVFTCIRTYVTTDAIKTSVRRS